MPVNKMQRAELERWANERESAARRMAKAKEDYEYANQKLGEILDSNNTKTLTFGNQRLQRQTVVDWQHFDAERAGKEFPIDQFPEVYLPNYKALKAYLNEQAGLPENDSRLIAAFTGYASRLRLTTLRKKGGF